MKNTIKFIASCALLAGATSAFASGNHAGGHGHGTEAIGKPGLAAKVSRTVPIDMSDAMRFTPDTITVRKGETVRFVVKNSGQLKHEFNLGTEKDLQAHYEVMKKFPEMEHDEPNIASVAPGQTGEVIWRFTTAGTVSFACLHPGHYDAGMKGSVKVGDQPADTMAQGEIRKIDKAAGKITIKHGDIPSLEMPPMTMVFTVKDPTMLDAVKAGDKIRFDVVRADGKLVVTRIESDQ